VRPSKHLIELRLSGNRFDIRPVISMTRPQFDSCESLRSLNWAICTSRTNFGSCPVAAEIITAATAACASFSTPIKSASFLFQINQKHKNSTIAAPEDSSESPRLFFRISQPAVCGNIV
jgi:hypothetical protein